MLRVFLEGGHAVSVIFLVPHDHSNEPAKDGFYRYEMALKDFGFVPLSSMPTTTSSLTKISIVIRKLQGLLNDLNPSISPAAWKGDSLIALPKTYLGTRMKYSFGATFANDRDRLTAVLIDSIGLYDRSDTDRSMSHGCSLCLSIFNDKGFYPPLQLTTTNTANYCVLGAFLDQNQGEISGGDNFSFHINPHNKLIEDMAVDYRGADSSTAAAMDQGDDPTENDRFITEEKSPVSCKLRVLSTQPSKGKGSCVIQ